VIFAKQSGLKELTIPRRAITGSIKDPSVFVVRGDSVVERKISAVVLDDKNVTVSQGLSAGEIVVISGQINLVNGSKIKLTN
jgi:hypothetical protein